MNGRKPARDLAVGDYVVTTFDAGEVAAVDTITTPGVVYAWLHTAPRGLAHEQRAADIILNHGDPVTVVKHRREV